MAYPYAVPALINLRYGSDSLTQAVDIAWSPEYDFLNDRGTPPRGVVVWIHGGSWAYGDKEEMVPYADVWAEAGYVIVNCSYRLTRAPIVDGNYEVIGYQPAAGGEDWNNVADIVTILRYLLIPGAGLTEAPTGTVGTFTHRTLWERMNQIATQYGTLVVGASAGGHLAVMGTFRHAELSGGVWPTALLNCVGPTNLVSSGVSDPINPHDPRLINIVINPVVINAPITDGSPYHLRNYWTTAIPNYFTHDCKIGLLYNTNDTIVPSHMARAFHDLLTADIGDQSRITSITTGTVLPGVGGWPLDTLPDHYVSQEEYIEIVSRDSARIFSSGQVFPRVNERLRPASGMLYPRPTIRRYPV